LDSLGGDQFVKKNDPQVAPKVVPKVVIDARMVFPQAHGIGRYVKNLAIGLAELAEKRALAYEPIFLTDHRYSGLLPSVFESVPVQAPFLNPSELLEIPSHLKRIGADAYHSPSFSSLAYAPCPWIATVHDLNHLKYGNAKQKIYYHVLLKRFAKKASALLTVSEFAKKELCDWLQLASARVDVAYNAIEPSFVKPLQPLTDADRSEFQALSDRKSWNVRSGEYFICLSNSKPHKNLSFLIRAYLDACKDTDYTNARQSAIPKLMLSVGAGELDFSSDDLKNGLMKDQVLFTSHLDDLEARLVLTHARAAVFPSQYEGFGLGPLEAIVSGAPVLVSDIAPHREGLCDFSKDGWTQWLSPADLKAWSQAFKALSLAGHATLDEPRVMHADSRFIAARNAAIERYSVKRLAEHMDRIYAGVLGIRS
jgi:glycosyltransferase involved in cell wall biosynthesis